MKTAHGSYNSGTFLLFLACTVIWVLDPAKYTTYIYNTTTVFSHCVGLRHVKHPITIESVVRIPPKQRGSTCLVKYLASSHCWERDDGRKQGHALVGQSHQK